MELEMRKYALQEFPIHITSWNLRCKKTLSMSFQFTRLPVTGDEFPVHITIWNWRCKKTLFMSFQYT
jgi:hypothetical protein